MKVRRYQLALTLITIATVLVLIELHRRYQEPGVDVDKQLHSLHYRLMISLQKLVNYFEKHAVEFNVDGVFGLVFLAGRIDLLLEDRRRGQSFAGYVRSTDFLALKEMKRQIDGSVEVVRKKFASQQSVTLTDANGKPGDDDSAINRYWKRFMPIFAVNWNVSLPYKPVDIQLKWSVEDQMLYQSMEASFNEERSDRCMSEILGTSSAEDNPFPDRSLSGANGQRCVISDNCLRMMSPRGASGYALTHQLLWMTMAIEFGCLVPLKQRLHEFIVGSDSLPTPLSSLVGLGRGRPAAVDSVDATFDAHLTEFCSNVWLTMVDRYRLAGFMNPPILQDLFLEEILTCDTFGFRQFLSPFWLEEILSWQRSSGCFGPQPLPTNHDRFSSVRLSLLGANFNSDDMPWTDLYSNIDETGNSQLKMLANGSLRWQSRQLQMEQPLGDHCLSHKMAVAAGALACFMRYLFEPDGRWLRSQVELLRISDLLILSDVLVYLKRLLIVVVPVVLIVYATCRLSRRLVFHLLGWVSSGFGRTAFPSQLQQGRGTILEEIPTMTTLKSAEARFEHSDDNATLNGTETTYGCALGQWSRPNHPLFHVASLCLLLAYCCPVGISDTTILHGLLAVAFLLFTTWSWIVLCSPDVLMWYFAMLMTNLLQAVFSLYRKRVVKLPYDLNTVYNELFEPLRVTREEFKRLTDNDNATVLTMHSGEPYATQFVTKANRLSLILSGSCHVMYNNHYLHSIQKRQFIDSPEFETTIFGMEKFQVSIIAAERTRYLCWQRDDLDYLLIKDPYLNTVISGLIAKDITDKLYRLLEQATDSPIYSLRNDLRLPDMVSLIKANEQMVLPFLKDQRRFFGLFDRHFIEAVDNDDNKETPKFSDVVTSTASNSMDKSSIAATQQSCGDKSRLLPNGNLLGLHSTTSPNQLKLRLKLARCLSAKVPAAGALAVLDMDGPKCTRSLSDGLIAEQAKLVVSS